MKNTIIVVLVIVILFLVAVGGVFIGLFIPAVQATRDAARRMQNANNLHVLSLGIDSYATANQNTLPPVYTEKEGKRLHSWRVQILPFLDEQELYDQIHLDEPWDSEWNKQFHDRCPKCFQNPKIALAPNQTTYAVVVGENTAFSGATGIELNSIKDGLSQTGIITERTPVCWMDPNSDIPFEEAIKGIGVSENGIQMYFMGSFPVVTLDGAIHNFTSEVSDSFLSNLFDTADGNRIDFFEVE